MALDFKTYVLNLQAGMQASIGVKTDLSLGISGFCKTGEVSIDGNQKSLTNGFVVRDDAVGSLSLTDGGDDTVIYKHLKSQENTIYFYASTGEIQTIDVITIPIHDHSSTSQGGPAYGTYYSDYTKEG